MKSGSGWLKAGLVLAVGTICIVFAGSSFGQVQTQKTTAAGQATKEVQVERGEVVIVNDDDLVVKMEDGSVRHFSNVPKSAKVSGQMVDAFGLKKGMTIHATKIVEVPESLVSQQRKLTGTMPPPPPAPPVDAPVLVAMAELTPAPTAAATAPASTPAPAKLPKTASELPLVGLLGLLCISASLGVRFLRAKLGV